MLTTDAAQSRVSLLLTVLAIAATAAFIGITGWQLTWGGGPFLWHISHPSSWQGALEAGGLAASIVAGFLVNRRWALLTLVALPTLLVLRRHGSDIPLALDLIQFEIVIGLGMALRRLLRLPAATESADYLLAFLAGFALWSVAAWTVSALNLGSINALRWLTLLLAIPALYGGQRPLSVYLWQRLRDQPAAGRFWGAVLLAWLISLFVRSRYAIGYDSLWYGLRGEFVLAPGDSLFEPLGLVSPVYYFPKIYEAFLLPLSGLGSSSVVGGMGVLLLVLLLLTCRLLMRAAAVPERAQPPLLAVIATLPALANFSFEAKPDVFATLLVLLAALFGIDWLRTRRWPALALMAATVALACSAKIAAIPFAGVLVLVTLAAALRPRQPVPRLAPERGVDARLASAILALALTAAAFVLARTWWLTGLPTIGPDPLFKLWLALGFEVREPAGTLSWTQVQDWREIPPLVLDWLLRPQRLPHIVVSWTGNVWLWLALLALAAAALGRRRVAAVTQRPWPLLALIAIGLVLATGNRYLVRGGDGNYFLYALLPAIILAGGAAFGRLATMPRAFAVALACLPAFALFQAGYSFVSGAWTPGTRALDLKFDTRWRDMRRRRADELEWAGLTRIGRHLREADGVPRVTGAVEANAKNWLPARFEDVETISYSRPDHTRSGDDLRRFIATHGIDYLIVPRPDIDREPPSVPAALASAAADLAQAPGVQRIVDRRYELLDLSGLDAAERARLLRVAER
ncbi:MAG TPA: hypothetical protein VMR06_18095 [Dokdonella sp.]|uniref:hypothetical protein n=1 Tax=Dokdonella sp. TaxID=2291710 RepID=UPI002B9A2797|nr:hypothetical protein [Dokdonella sp.]HUD43900.1 hypothetical protein [Dokdonella sp.]